MGTHHVSRMVPALFHPEIAARNGRLPAASMLRRMANSYNGVATRQRKLLFLKWQDFRHMVSPSSGPAAVVWPFYFRTGDNVDALEVHAGITATDSVLTPGIPSRLVVEIYRASDLVRMNVGDEGDSSHNQSFTGTSVGPQDISHITMRLHGLAPNTEYYCESLCLFGMRLAYLSVHEMMKRDADDSVTVICNASRYITEGPIQRAAITELNQAAKGLWRHNASHFFSWCPNYDQEDAPSTSSTTFSDLIANTATMRLETTNRGTLQRPNAIPVKIAVKALRTAGSGTADFRLFDGTNSITISAAAISSSARLWFTGTGTLSGTPASWRMQHRVSVGTTTVFTMGFCAFQFEA